LLGINGSFGLIATNTIAQGDTRTAGLAVLVSRGWRLYDTVESIPWPGAAAVVVSLVHAAHGKVAEQTTPRRNGVTVETLNSYLRARPERADPKPLRANSGAAFVGSYVLGTGFALEPDERDELVRSNPRNDERIRPYLGGEEVNTNLGQTFDRYIINFEELCESEARRWPALWAVLEKRVRPDRITKDAKKYPRMVNEWWKYWNPRHDLYAALKGTPRCLVTARVSKHLMFCFQPCDRVFSEQLYVFPIPTMAAFAILQSRVHEHWTRLLSSSMGDGLRYSASDCFDTYPFPEGDPRRAHPRLEAAGQRLYEARTKYMDRTQQGLTKTYNALKDPACDDALTCELRRIHEDVDGEVLAAYGWKDIAVPTYRVEHEDQLQSQTFEDEVIDRLYVLNAQRAEEELLGGPAQANQNANRPQDSSDGRPVRGSVKKAHPRAAAASGSKPRLRATSAKR
jgi:hypothetical protein